MDSSSSNELESLGSVSQWIDQVKQDDDSAAANELWNRYFSELRDYAKTKFTAGPALDADEEDAALMAFHAMLDGFSNGRFNEVNNRDEFWRLLAAITKRNVMRIYRRNKRIKRGGGHTRSGTPPEEICDQVNAEGVIELSDTIRSIVDKLPSERYRRVFYLRAAGHSIKDIVELTGQSRRTVDRQLHAIRQIWSKLD